MVNSSPLLIRRLRLGTIQRRYFPSRGSRAILVGHVTKHYDIPKGSLIPSSTGASPVLITAFHCDFNNYHALLIRFSASKPCINSLQANLHSLSHCLCGNLNEYLYLKLLRAHALVLTSGHSIVNITYVRHWRPTVFRNYFFLFGCRRQAAT